MLTLLLTLALLRLQAPTLETLSWMKGCWETRGPGSVVDERWTAPQAGHMLGLGRTIRGDSLRSYELTIIRVRNGTLVYEAHPSGQEPATFTASTATDSMVVFRNPEHDFPQEVGYRKAGPDAMTAWVLGRINGNARRQDFPYRRIRCD